MIDKTCGLGDRPFLASDGGHDRDILRATAIVQPCITNTMSGVFFIANSPISKQQVFACFVFNYIKY